jgi:hypothetical protein
VLGLGLEAVTRERGAESSSKAVPAVEEMVTMMRVREEDNLE